jgi:Polysaccharide pyruvyl transferase
MRLLIAGWFSFEEGHATAGDLLACELVCDWLDEAGYPYDVALAPPFIGGIDWRQADPADYFAVTFVCGPFSRGPLEAEFLGRFAESTVIGLNLTMIEPLASWNPFDSLLERDSTERVRPEIVFLSRRPRVPVVGVCRVEPYDGAMVAEANAAIRHLIIGRELAAIDIDTRLDENLTGLRSSGEIESLISRVDVLITTRLHGMVLALKNGVPAIVIDPEDGGSKIQRQAEEIGWPVVHTIDRLDPFALERSLTFCLTDEARALAVSCGDRAAERVLAIRRDFLAALLDPEIRGQRAGLRTALAAEFRPMSRNGGTSSAPEKIGNSGSPEGPDGTRPRRGGRR